LSCRKSLAEEYSSFSCLNIYALNQPNSSEKYMQIISESTDSISIAYGCSIREISNDTKLGRRLYLFNAKNIPRMV
jgi:hypothetical protein